MNILVQFGSEYIKPLTNQVSHKNAINIITSSGRMLSIIKRINVQILHHFSHWKTGYPSS